MSVDRLALRGAALLQFADAAAGGNRRGKRRAARTSAVVGGENRQRAVADQLEHVAAVFVDRQKYRVGIFVQQRDAMFWRGVGDAGEAAQIAEPDDGVDLLGDAAHNAAASTRRPGSRPR